MSNNLKMKKIPSSRAVLPNDDVRGITVLNTEESYLSEDGIYLIRRETGNETPNGNDTGGRWVLRVVKTEDFLDIDQYRHDLMERWFMQQL